MRKIYTATNPVDAHLLKGVLESEGIPAVVQGEFLWNTRGEVPISAETSPSVWVIDDMDYDRAVELVKVFQYSAEGIDSASPEWQCDKCNESNEGQFTECWHCGASRDGGH